MSNAELAIGIVSVITIFGGLTLVGCVWLWAWRGRSAVEREEAYQKLAEEATAAQKRTAFELGQIAEDVGELRTRVTELERMLREVG